MKLNIVRPQISSSLVPTICSLKYPSETNHKSVRRAVFLSPIRARNLLRFQDLIRSFDRGDTVKRYCSVNLDGGLGDELFEFRYRLAEGCEEKYGNNRGCCTINEKSLPVGSGDRKKDSNFPSQFDPLEPVMLGIKPDPPNWPERQSIMWTNIEQKAKNLGLPLSLRMIKKKLQWEVGVRDLGELACCSVRKAFSSMVFIVVQLQTYALQMREALQDEDLEPILAKVQQEMCASYVWLFQRVFSRTPVLMIYIMILLANFSVYSASHNVAIADTLVLGPASTCEIAEETVSVSGLNKNPNLVLEELSGLNKNPDLVPEELSGVACQELRNETEIRLWNSIVNEATEIQGLEEVELDHETMWRFVSPLSVDIERDNFVDYKMDFVYQMMLSQDPYNTLLLCNYAQFLHCVAQDYDRAEECFKQATQLEPPEAEVLSQYASFLWTVRKDLCGAEERYRQAIAAEPGNPYYASRYANFLWSTGGEERMNASYDSSKTLNS